MEPTGRIVAVTVLGDDRPGIVADVTEALVDLGGNLEDSTMTLLRGHFAMVVLVRTPASTADVEQRLAGLTRDGGLVIDVRELVTHDTRPQQAANLSVRVYGADRPGIVAGVTRVVADHGANIVDLGTRLGRDLYVLVADVAVPTGIDAQALEHRLRDTASRLGVEVRVSSLDDDVL